MMTPIKKILIGLVLCAISVSCTKNNTKPSYNAPLKSVRTVQNPASVNIFITNHDFEYNSLGQLFRVVRTDSFGSYNPKWTVTTQTLCTYFYNSFNKVSEVKSYDHQTSFVYDADQKLISEITSYTYAAPSDTTFYTYSNNLTITTTKNANCLIKSYYSKNLDSVTYTNNISSVIYSRAYYNYSTRGELCYNYYRLYSSNIKNTNEIDKIIQITDSYSVHGELKRDISTSIYSRTYDSENYPTTETVNIDGRDQMFNSFTFNKGN